jgi:hypothetical protein
MLHRFLLLSACCLFGVTFASAQTPAPSGSDGPVILTPPSPKTPLIHGPKIFGVRPGSPFLYTISATGDRPMTFSADGLPAGLKLDGTNGQITGTLTQVGASQVTFHAKNSLGQADRLDAFTLGLLTNDEVIDVNQDELGKQATNVSKQGELEVCAKPLADGSRSVGLFNLGNAEAPVTVKWSDLGLSGKQKVRDLWRQQDVGAFNDSYTTPVASHGVVLARVIPAK